MNKKMVPLILIIVGVALLFGSIIFVIDRATAVEASGLGEWIFNILGLLLGAGAGIKGWLDLKKLNTDIQGGTREEQRTQDAIDSPGSEQFMEGKGGVQKQKTTRSPRSKQTMK